MLKGQKYSVLLASSNEKFDAVLLSLLPSDEYGPADIVNSAGAARRALLDRPYDIFMVNAPLKDEMGAKLAVDAASDTGSGVMLFVDAAKFDEMAPKVEEYGVLTLAKPTRRVLVVQSLRLICATRQRLMRMEQKTLSFEEKINEIQLVNRAKLLLIEREGFNEEDAHKFIQREAMDMRVSRKSVAREIIERYEDS